MMTDTVELGLKLVKREPRIDSRRVAEGLGTSHKSFFELVKYHKDALLVLLILPFKTEKLEKIGRPQKYALLNEDQVYFLLTLSRNTPIVIGLKLNLVKVFSEARYKRQLEDEYLPFYHELHGEVKYMADVANKAGSKTSERIFHINANKMVNRALRLKQGKRQSLSAIQRLAITTANAIARQAIRQTLLVGGDHHSAYEEARHRVESYAVNVHTLLEHG